MKDAAPTPVRTFIENDTWWATETNVAFQWGTEKMVMDKRISRVRGGLTYYQLLPVNYHDIELVERLVRRTLAD